jgi:cytochrome P450
VLETLRLYPAFFVLPREVATPFSLGGMHFRRGDILYVSPYLLQRDARSFSNPERFDPERFMGESQVRLAPGSFMPFGAGPRACPGRSFTLNEQVLVWASLLQDVRLTPRPGATPQQVARVSLHLTAEAEVALGARAAALA